VRVRAAAPRAASAPTLLGCAARRVTARTHVHPHFASHSFCCRCMACVGEPDAPRITLADVDASLEPVAPFDIEEEGGVSGGAVHGVGAGAPQDALALLAAAPRAVTERAAHPRAPPPGFDPWANDRGEMSAGEIVAACVLVPPRVAACIALACAALPLSIALLALAAALPPAKRNSAAVRALVCAPIRFLCRLALLGAGFWWIEYEHRAQGAHRTASGANIIVANHASVADVLWSVWALAPAFLAKREALRIPYVGAAARALGCVFVARDSADSRAAARAAIAERAGAGASASRDPPLLIFPEGTTTNGLCCISWERGAFTPGRPVLPLAISYPKGQPKPDALFSIETLRAIARPYNRMRIAFLRPHLPDAVEARSPALYAAVVRARVAAALDVPLCAQTYRDGLHRTRREGPPPAGTPAAAALRATPPPLPWRAQQQQQQQQQRQEDGVAGWPSGGRATPRRPPR
jgi:1-acyl-sn-glycerol-3-phosphate acyltransferase